ncbi:MAG: YhfC family intramembrane metalloprotease [Clostridiales bacterium]|nr:YhfC family intramembrane metalloprotease [Clostridiales bacterium]
MELPGITAAILAGVILPIGAGIWLSAKKKGYLKPVLLGAATFCVFQILTRIPLLQVILPDMLWYIIFSQTQPILYALFLAVTAALFEEGGRWLVMTLLMKNRRRTSDGIAFGVGHGGIEAFYFLGIGAVLLLLDPAQSFIPSNLLWGSFERICTIILHIAWSVMVLKSVAEKKPMWLLLAFLLHTVIDMAAVFMQQEGASVPMMEAVIGVFALMHLVYILAEYKKVKGAEIH